ncbi:MAG: DUF1919 domain-containing protein [Lachnospiraceae bacterium]
MTLKTILKGIRNQLRYLLLMRKKERYLNDKNITIISSDYTGGMLYHDFNMQFLSPTINMYMDAQDYLKFINNIKYYLDKPFIECPEDEKQEGYPVALLGDIKLHLVHYHSVEEAQEKWNERKTRINFQRLYFIMNDRNFCSPNMVAQFDEFLSKKNYSGVCFTHIPYKNLQHTYYIKGSENKDFVDIMTAYTGPFKRRLDQFDWVLAFNNVKHSG